MEMPFETAVRALEHVAVQNLAAVLDPGGLSKDADPDRLLGAGIYLLKPNEHEAQYLTGIKVDDFHSAERAAKLLMKKGAEHVLITHGEHGAYLFGPDISLEIPIPSFTMSTQQTDAIGCGDQVMATLCTSLSNGKELTEAARIAVAAGTLQFHRVGVQPLSPDEIAAISENPLHQAIIALLEYHAQYLHRSIRYRSYLSELVPRPYKKHRHMSVLFLFLDV